MRIKYEKIPEYFYYEVIEEDGSILNSVTELQRSIVTSFHKFIITCADKTVEYDTYDIKFAGHTDIEKYIKPVSLLNATVMLDIWHKDELVNAIELYGYDLVSNKLIS